MRSQYFLQCLDNSLDSGLGLKLADFKWPPYPKPLRSHEKREFEAVEAERPYGEALVWGGSQKSVIVDTATGQRHVEVAVLGKPPQEHLPPSLHLCMGRESAGMPWQVVGYRLASKLQHSDSLPGTYVLLLPAEKTVQDGALRGLERLWKRLLELKSLAFGHHSRALLGQRFFPQMVWVRSVLVLLAEVSYSVAPSLVDRETKTLYTGNLTTNINECFCNVLRSHASGNPGEDTTTIARWVITARGSLESILLPQVSSGRWHCSS
jgi:hypothetical protein